MACITNFESSFYLASIFHVLELGWHGPTDSCTHGQGLYQLSFSFSPPFVYVHVCMCMHADVRTYVYMLMYTNM